MKHKKISLLSIFLVVFFSIIIEIVIFVHGFFHHEVKFPTLVEMLINARMFTDLIIRIYNLFFAAQFCIFAFEIRERFEILNRKLRKDFISFTGNIMIVHDKRNSSKLKQFSILYHDMCDGIEIINSTFTFQLIFVFSSCLVSLKVIFYRF
jgi:hypothetical protein